MKTPHHSSMKLKTRMKKGGRRKRKMSMQWRERRKYQCMNNNRPSEFNNRSTNNNMEVLPQPFLCRTIRVGSYQIHAKEENRNISVSMSTDGISFYAPMVSDASKMVNVVLKPTDVTHMLVHLGKCIPVLFIFTTKEFAEALRKSLDMSLPGFPCYDPLSQDETENKITFLIDSVTEDQRNFLRHQYLNEEKIKELNQKTANEILVKSTPTQKSIEKSINESVEDVRVKSMKTTEAKDRPRGKRRFTEPGINENSPPEQYEAEDENDERGEEEEKEADEMKEEEEMIKDEMEEKQYQCMNNNMEVLPQPFLCRSIRVGSYKIPAKGGNNQIISVSMSTDDISFYAPMVSDVSKMVNVVLKPTDVTHVLVHLGKCLPILFIFTTEEFAEALRKSLDMPFPGFPYYDPLSIDETENRITFLMDGVTEDHRNFLRHQYLSQKKFQEIDQKTANEILVKSTPSQPALAVKTIPAGASQPAIKKEDNNEVVCLTKEEKNSKKNFWFKKIKRKKENYESRV